MVLLELIQAFQTKKNDPDTDLLVEVRWEMFIQNMNKQHHKLVIGA